MNTITPMRTSTPAFGMALKQKEIVDKLKNFSQEEMKNYLAASNRIHKASEKTGFNIKLTKSIDHLTPNTIILGIESKSHPEFAYKKGELTIKQLQTQSKQFADEMIAFLKGENKRIKSLDQITKKFG